ncbi:acyltransferase [Nocardioides baekrokdamisoli]|uniref:Acyltransferase n=1 Tax=Nocardioides baekrokdamisoli TaxID=1804624 RepID=A0A3G9IGT4_9ACTN|nr:acyltransferase [Nocardioides baekrokdamisoli]
MRGEIQALRALAASMVVLFHVWPALVPGGYAGVDVFFVISGYLITAHLLTERERHGRIHFGAFWARRARRLLPAAYTVIVVSAIGVLLWIPLGERVVNFRELVASSAYFENWRLAHDAVDYLAQANAPSVIQHYWTLSVEEQFYLVWPLLIAGALMLRRWLRWGVPAVVGTVTVASFAYSLWMTATHPATAYFVTPVRVWEFGVGALVVMGDRRLWPSLPPWLADLLVWGGIILVGLTSFELSGSTAFPGWAALMPTLGAAAVIAGGTRPGRLSPQRLLGLWPIQELGAISYAVYLWHWPLLILAPHALGHRLTELDRWVIVVLTLVFAELSTRTIEQWFRTTPRIAGAKPVWALSGAAIAAAVTVGLLASAQSNASSQISANEARVAAMIAHPPPCFGAAAMDPTQSCPVGPIGQLVPTPATANADFPSMPNCFNDYTTSTLLSCTYGPVGDPRVPVVALIGDSHALSYLPPLIRLAQEHKLVVMAQLKAHCPWVDTAYAAAISASCGQFQQKVDGWLRTNAHRIDVVLTLGRYDTMPGDLAARVKAVAAAWRTANADGIPVAGIVDQPYRADAPTPCLALLDRVEATSCSVPRGGPIGALRAGDPTRGAVAAVRRAVAIDLTDFFCGPTICPAVIGGVTVYRDPSHMTSTFAATLGPYVWRDLVATGWLTAAH